MPAFSDTLDGSVGDLLRLRSGWSRPIGADEASIVTGFTGGFALATGTTLASSTWHAPTSQPASADQYLTALLDTTANVAIWPLVVRADLSSNLGAAYMARHGPSGQLQLFRRTSAGAQISMGSAVITAADLATNPVTLKAVGNQISVEFKGSTVIGPVTDNTAASGSVAMLSRGGTTATRAQIYSWESGEVGGGTAIASAETFAFGATANAGVATAMGSSAAIAFGQTSALAVSVGLSLSGSAGFGQSASLASSVALAGVGAFAFGQVSSLGEPDAVAPVRFLTLMARTKSLTFNAEAKPLAFRASSKRLAFVAREGVN